MSVVLYHFGLGCPGGYVGVDVFFVISGFLITKVVSASAPSSGMLKFMTGFWLRRIRRLAPALAVTTLLTLVATYPFIGDTDRLHAAWASLYQLGFAANFYYFAEAGYFGPDPESLLFLHHWSLAVEEQFYLVFPFVLLVCLARGKVVTIAVLTLTALSSLALCVLTTREHPDFSFYLLPTRAWELLSGALLAIGNPRPLQPRPVREALAWTSLSAIVVSIFWYDHATNFPGAAALAPCLGTVGLIYAGSSANSVRSALASRPFVWIGLISYSLYLVHWPISAMTFYTAVELPAAAHRTAMVGLCLVAAWASWKFVETPIRTQTLLRGARSLSLAFAASTLLVGSISLALIFRVPATPDHLVPDVSMQELAAGRAVRIGAEGAASAEPYVLLWGDSHAQMLSRELSNILAEEQLPGLSATKFSNIPLLGVELPGEQERNERVMEIIQRQKPQHVLMIATWWAYVLDPEKVGNRLFSLDETTPEDASSLEVFERALQQTVQRIEAAGAQPWIMLTVPHQHQHVPRRLIAAAADGIDPKMLGVTVAEHRETQGPVNNVIHRVARGSKLRVLEPLDYLTLDNGRTQIEVEGAPAYLDGSHIDPIVGAALLRPLLEKILER